MSLVAGTATITVTKNVSGGGGAGSTVTWTATYGGTGLASVLAQARFALTLAAQGPYTRTGKTTFDTNTENAVTGSLTGQATAMAAQAQADAQAIVTYFTANAVCSTTVSAGGLQKTPNPNNPDTATAAPASPVTLTGTLS